MKQWIASAALTVPLLGCTWPAAEPPIDFLGAPAPPVAAERTIVIRPDTRWVNVTGGETIRFVVGDKSFAWAFNVAATVHAFELNRIAPPGMLDHRVTAYVAPDPRYTRDGGGRGGRR
jgi:hypothetical protein